MICVKDRKSKFPHFESFELFLKTIITDWMNRYAESYCASIRCEEYASYCEQTLGWWQAWKAEIQKFLKCSVLQDK